jgi:cysteine-rich repeat protein
MALLAAVLVAVAMPRTAAVCGNGVVEPGEQCDDGNTADGDCCSSTCQDETAGTPCDDGIFCNGPDTCRAGACVHEGDPCLGGAECADVCREAEHDCVSPAGTECADDGNFCTDDVCDGAGACGHPANTDPCDDGASCTMADTCANGECHGTPVADGTDCDDGLFCTVEDLCQAGVCHGTARDCGSSNACTTAVCNEAAGRCDVTLAANGTPCDDGRFCDGAERCFDGTCAAGPVPCTGGCDDTADRCMSCGNGELDPGEECDDGNVAGGDGCDAHCRIECETASDCDDGIACTVDLCTPRGCWHTFPAGQTCCTSDADCTASDPCMHGQCDASGTCVFEPAGCFDGMLCPLSKPIDVRLCFEIGVASRVSALMNDARTHVARAQARVDRIEALARGTGGRDAAQMARSRKAARHLLRNSRSRITRAHRVVVEAGERGWITPLCAAALGDAIDGRRAEFCAAASDLPSCAPGLMEPGTSFAVCP